MWMVCQYIYSSIFNLECVILYAIRKYTQAQKLLVVEITWFVRIKITCIILLFITCSHNIYLQLTKSSISCLYLVLFNGIEFSILCKCMFSIACTLSFLSKTQTCPVLKNVGLNDYSSLLYTYFYFDQFGMHFSNEKGTNLDHRCNSYECLYWNFQLENRCKESWKGFTTFCKYNV